MAAGPPVGTAARPAKWAYLVVLVAAVAMVGLTGHLGGTLVYGHGHGHGLGVKPVAAEPSAP